MTARTSSGVMGHTKISHSLSESQLKATKFRRDCMLTGQNQMARRRNIGCYKNYKTPVKYFEEEINVPSCLDLRNDSG